VILTPQFRRKVNPGTLVFAGMAALLIGGCVAAAEGKDAGASKEAKAPETAQNSEVKADAKTDSKTKAAPKDPKAAAVDAVLDKLEQRAKQVKSMQVDVTYVRIQGLTSDEQRRLGSLYYTAGPPARFAVRFNYLIVPSGRNFKRIDQNRWYIFDGVWLVERQDDKKRFVKRQVVPTGKNKANEKEADRPDPLADGSGPFVIPLNFKKKPIVDRYHVTLIKPDSKRDPKGSIHLRLKPKDHVRMRITEIDLWYDAKTLLPLQARTNDRSENESIIKLKPDTMQVNKKIDFKIFDTTPPKARGWNVEIKPWEDPSGESPKP